MPGFTALRQAHHAAYAAAARSIGNERSAAMQAASEAALAALEELRGAIGHAQAA